MYLHPYWISFFFLGEKNHPDWRNLQIAADNNRELPTYLSPSVSISDTTGYRMTNVTSKSIKASLESFDETMLLSVSRSCADQMSTCGLTRCWREFEIVSTVPGDLSKAEQIKIYNMLEKNMKLWYEKNWGWKESEKKKELFHPDSRFLCVYKPPSSNANTPTHLEESEKELIAFVMFRFEWDDEDEPEHPVVFCYEIQIAQEYRGLSIGRHLMDLLVKISKHWRMWKVLLTCFKNNESAMDFYHKIGFGIDANSPSACGYRNEDYEILSNVPKMMIKK